MKTMSINTHTERRTTYSVRINDEARERITTLTERLGVSQSELIETAVAGLHSDNSAIRVEMIKSARASIAEADETLATLERGRV
jgi:predicted transcriptional regulator